MELEKEKNDLRKQISVIQKAKSRVNSESIFKNIERREESIYRRVGRIFKIKEAVS